MALEKPAFYNELPPLSEAEVSRVLEAMVIDRYHPYIKLSLSDQAKRLNTRAEFIDFIARKLAFSCMYTGTLSSRSQWFTGIRRPNNSDGYPKVDFLLLSSQLIVRAGEVLEQAHGFGAKIAEEDALQALYEKHSSKARKEGCALIITDAKQMAQAYVPEVTVALNEHIKSTLAAEVVIERTSLSFSQRNTNPLTLKRAAEQVDLATFEEFKPGAVSTLSRADWFKKLHLSNKSEVLEKAAALLVQLGVPSAAKAATVLKNGLAHENAAIRSLAAFLRMKGETLIHHEARDVVRMVGSAAIEAPLKPFVEEILGVFEAVGNSSCAYRMTAR